jgi:voltage-gated potassium channel
VADVGYVHPLRGRLRFILSGMALIDLLAILPFYLPFMGLDLRFIRAFRLVRIVRIAKVGRYYSSLTLIRDTIRSRKEELILTFEWGIGVGPS